MAKIVTGAVLIGGAIALDVVTAGAATPLEVAAITSLGSMGATLMLSGIAQWLHLGDTGQQGVTGRKGFRPWQIIYGRQRVTGAVIDESLSDGGNGDNRWLWVVEAIAAHFILAIDATYLNQQQAFCNRNVNNGFNSLAGNLIGTDSTDGGDMSVNGMVQPIHPTDLNFREYSNFYWDGNPRFWMAQYDGSQTAADPFYMALCATNPTTNTPHWDSTCVGNGIAYSLNRFWSNSNWSAGKPVVQYDVRGKRDIYDPRSGTSGYSENATLVLADYMMNQKWGMMFEIGDFDPDTLIAAANICDEVITLSFAQIVNTVTYTTEPRYYINATISTSSSGGQIMQMMLEAMAGRISFIGGAWFIFPGVWQGTSGVTIIEGDFLSSFEWRPTRKSRDLFNEVRGQFMCANGWNTVYAQGFDVYNVTAQTVENNFNGQWQMTDMPPFAFDPARDYSTDPYLTEDGGIKYIKNVSYPYTISVAYAQRLSKILLLRNRWQGTGTIKLPIQFIGIQPNDVIEVDYARFGWTGKTVEVLATHINLGSVDAQGNFTPPSISIDIAECDPSIYTWLSTDELSLAGGQAMGGPTVGDPAAPTNLVLTSGVQTFNTPNGTVFGGTLIEASWTASQDASVTNGGWYSLYLQQEGTNTWIWSANVAGSVAQALLFGVSSGITYTVGIEAYRYDGAHSTMTTGTVTVGDVPISVSASDVLIAASQGTAQSISSSIAKNLVPDSEMQLWAAYWSNVGSGWSTLPATGFGGMNGKVAPSTLSGVQAQSNSSSFALVVGEEYTLSGAINATTVTAGSPCWQVISPGGANVYATCAQVAGVNGRVYATFAFSPSGYSTGQVVDVQVWANTAACTFTGNLIFSAPMVAAVNGLTPYCGNFADDLTGNLTMGGMPTQVQALFAGNGSLPGTLTVNGGTGNDLIRIDNLSALAAPLASPAFTGTPTAPTAAPLTDDAQVATTAYSDAAVSVEKSRAEAAEALLAPLASPVFSGTVTAPTLTATTITNTASVLGVDGNAHTLEQVAHGATGINGNLVPDSSLQFGWAFWSKPGSAWTIVPIAETGCNGFQVTNANSGEYIWTATSEQFYLIAGSNYVISGYFDNTNVTNFSPSFGVWNPTISTNYMLITQEIGVKGRVSATFTMAIPSGYSAGQPVPCVLIFDTSDSVFTGNIYASAPMIQSGTLETAYVPNIMGNAATTFLVENLSLTSANTAMSSTAGSASALPATPSGYLELELNGATVKIPYYNS